MSNNQKKQHQLSAILRMLLLSVFMGTAIFSLIAGAATVVDADMGSGEGHGIALLSDGTAWTYGWNGHGELGNGQISSKNYPPVKIMNGVKAVDAGMATTAFLKTDGTLWMCGHNEYGELGDGTKTNRSTPVQVLDQVQQVSAGCGVTAAIRTDGTLWICGINFQGLTNRKSGDGFLTFTKVMDNVKFVCAGEWSFFVIKKDNSLWVCMGRYSDMSMFGIEKKEDVFEEPVKVMENVQYVSSEGSHAAVLKTDGTLWMTGDNEYGELGDGTREERETPFCLTSGVKKVETGSNGTLIQKTDGTLWACGNSYAEFDGSILRKINGPKTQQICGGSEGFQIIDNEGNLWSLTDVEYKAKNSFNIFGFNYIACPGYENNDIVNRSFPFGDLSIRLQLLIGNAPAETKTENDTSLKKGDTFPGKIGEFLYNGTKGIILKNINKDLANRAKVVVPATETYNGITYNVTEIAPGAGMNLKASEVVIGPNVTKVGKNAFKNSKNLKKVTGAKGVTQYGDSAFEGCKKLTSAAVGDNVTSIGTKAFAGCTSLTKITIPSKVTKIGASAFQSDKKLKTVTIKTTKLTTKKVGKNAFKGISAKATIKVPKKKLKAYKKWLTKKGLPKKAKIK